MKRFVIYGDLLVNKESKIDFRDFYKFTFHEFYEFDGKYKKLPKSHL